jgi:hypothetical protein
VTRRVHHTAELDRAFTPGHRIRRATALGTLTGDVAALRVSTGSVHEPTRRDELMARDRVTR